MFSPCVILCIQKGRKADENTSVGEIRNYKLSQYQYVNETQRAEINMIRAHDPYVFSRPKHSLQFTEKII
jgi:hypothetical protein